MLGRRPPKGAPAIRFRTVWTGAVPDHPLSADHFAQVTDWGLYTNDRYGVCGPTSVANQRKLLTRYLTGAEESPTQEDVYDLYRRSGNPAFDPVTGAGDDGVDMQTMLEALLEGGIGGVKPIAFAKVDHTRRDEVLAAIAIFGSVLCGVSLEVAQQDQTDTGLWDYQRSDEWGGHAVLSGRYTDPAGTARDRTGVVTWAQVVDATDVFLARQLDEVWVVVWPEQLSTRQFAEGIDLARLAATYQELTGRVLPVAPPAPAPPPGPTPPTPSGPLAELAALLRRALRDVDAWLTKHGL
jgi:hypothetical protein